MYTRDAFDRQRALVTRVGRRHERRLALLSVTLGVAQLLFLRWADVHLERGPRNAIAGPCFVAYMALVLALLWRMQRSIRAVRPVCPQCGVRLEGTSESVAAATGRCDACGGQVIA